MAANDRVKDFRYDVTIHNHSLEIQVQNDRKRSRAFFIASISDNITEKVDTVKVKFDVISVWVDPETSSAIKAYLTFPKSGRMAKVFRDVFRRDKMLKYGIDKQFVCDDNLNVIRFGVDGGSNYTIKDNDSYGEFTVFNSKSQVVSEILSQSPGSVAVGGFDTVNFNAMPSDVFEGLGVQELPDQLGRSPSLWMVNPHRVVSGGEFTSSYDSSRSNRTANINSFINIIKERISA